MLPILQRLWFTAVLALAIATLAAPAPRHVRADDDFTSRFEAAACAAPLPAGVEPDMDVRCGYVTVPERHDVPYSRSIQLAVAVIKASTPGTSDPIVFIDGGPGLSSLHTTFPLLLGFYGQPVRQSGRDLIMFEQRGNFASKPNLQCNEVADAFGKGLSLEHAARRDLIVKAYRDCAGRLQRSGVNLSAYNSLDNAADIPLVVKALGYETYNVYGVSYGSLVAQHLMRSYPQGVRSAVLSSVMPPNRNVNAAIPESADRSFKLFFDACSEDDICGVRYPDLEAVFHRLVNRLNQTPLLVPVKTADGKREVRRPFSGDDLVRLLSESLDAFGIPSIPKAIDDLDKGETGWLSQRLGMASGTGTESLGMLYSVVCSEGADFSEADLRRDNPIRNAMADGRPLEMLAVCRDWPVARLAESAHEAVASGIPALLMAGEFDVITPPHFLEIARAKLKNSYAFIYPGQGHGGIDPCRLTMMLSFYANPGAAPDAGCIHSMSVSFTPPPGPPGP
jgi:pimeloyl-ACP methyl ester carboxylesterase